MKSVVMPRKTKDEFVRLRVDEDLKRALAEAAYRDCRSETDEARYLLMQALGLLQKGRVSVSN